MPAGTKRRWPVCGASDPCGGGVLENHSRKGSREEQMLSRVTCGPEAVLPDGMSLLTPDGEMRNEIRIKWWLDLSGATCREAVFPDNPSVPDVPPRFLPPHGYPEDAPATFFGHYALREKKPRPLRANVACLDLGMGKGGTLCAYRWDGESSIVPEKFVIAPGEFPGEGP